MNFKHWASKQAFNLFQPDAIHIWGKNCAFQLQFFYNRIYKTDSDANITPGKKIMEFGHFQDVY